MYTSRGAGYLFAAMVGVCVFGAIKSGLDVGPAGPIVFLFLAALFTVLLVWNIRQQKR